MDRVLLPKIKMTAVLLFTFTFLFSNFTPVLAIVSYTISGNSGVGSVTLTIEDTTTWTITSESNGSYSFSVDGGWTGSITPSKAGFTFDPGFAAYSNVQDNTTANFDASPITYTISGNAGVTGVALSYTDGDAKTTYADGSGDYSFTVSYDWSGTVTPTLGGYTFFPPSKTYTNVLQDQTDQNYAAVGRYSITGTITNAVGSPIENASVVVPGRAAVLTDASGVYTLTDLNPDTDYTITPSLQNYTFHPADRTVNTSSAVNWVVGGVDFTGLQTDQNADATLKSLTSDYGAFNRSFQPEVTSYTLSAANRFSTITVTPVASQALAQIEVTFGGSAVTPSAGAYTITPLVVGANEVNIKVTAPDSAVTKTYKLTVNQKEDDYPVRWASNPPVVATAGSPYSYTMRATNDYQHPLTFSFEAGHERPIWLTLTNNGDGTATLSGTPQMGDLGLAPVWLQVEDSSFKPSLTASGAQFFIITVLAQHKTFIPTVVLK